MNALLNIKDAFAGFTKSKGYDPSHPEKLTAPQKHQIRRYYNIMTEYEEGGPVVKIPFKDLSPEIKKYGKKGFEKVKRAAQMFKGIKKAKYVYLKYDGETIPKISLRNGAPFFYNKKAGYGYETIEINKKSLAEDTKNSILKLKDVTQGAKYYRIMVGKHEYYIAHDLESLYKKVKKLQEKYAVGSGNHAYDNWLHGISVYYSDILTDSQIINYQRKYKEAFKDRVSKANKAARRKRQ